MKNINIDRRKFLKNSGLISALGLSIINQNSVIAAQQFWETSDTQIPYKLQLLTPAQFNLLRSICSHVIPKTDTLGAVEVGCAEFVDHQLKNVYSPSKQTEMIVFLNLVDEASKTLFQTKFIELASEQQLTLLQKLEAQEAPFNVEIAKQFESVKSLIVFGYFTSEVGAREALNYLPVPGGFTGQVSLKQYKKGFSPKAYY